jgi:hypothetical protein
MTKARLTRQELSWLLAQEAQNAAERLRVGVKVMRTYAPPPLDVVIHDEAPPDSAALHVDASLDALDDVMKKLSNLNLRQSSNQVAVPPRRGRIDLAALIVEIAPQARVAIEPGSGTEVYGDEADFRRMLQVLIGHGSGEGASITVRREGDDVRVATTLGPEMSPTANTERAWLSRMAIRYGGRHDLEGGTEMLVLPAEAASDRSEREFLRRELDEARRQGEIQARELKAMFDRGEEISTISSAPPPPATPNLGTSPLARVCTALAAALSPLIGRLDHADTLAAAKRELTEAVTSLESMGQVPAIELATEVDLVATAKAVVREAKVDASVEVLVTPTDANRRIYVRAGAKGLTALVRELLRATLACAAPGSRVHVNVAERAGVPELVVEGSSLGRLGGTMIFLAREVAASLGARLETSDARTTVTFGNA